jgi:hypothetical protein
MTFIFSLIAALSLSSIPLIIGWRQTAGEADLARQLGISEKGKKFDPDKFAKQTGTGLTFNQILIGFLAWIGGSFFAGLSMGLVAAILFALAGGLLYSGTLSDRRQEFSMLQAKSILRALGMIETLLMQGKPLQEALDEATKGVDVSGQIVLLDLVVSLRSCDSGTESRVVRAWATTWDNPAVHIVATVLYSYYTLNVQITPLIGSLRVTLTSVVEILSRARAAAKGIEWQAKFLAVFPPFVLVFVGITTPEAGQLYARNPLYLFPVLLGSALSYWLSMRMVRNGLSMEASMGMGGEGEMSAEQMGAV